MARNKRAAHRERQRQIMEPELEIQIWSCSICWKEFVDPEDYSSQPVPNKLEQEVRLYWLGAKPVCSKCAAFIGIPPIDKE